MFLQSIVSPQPHRSAVMPETAQEVLLVVVAVLAMAVAIYAIFECRRRRDLVPVYILLGAALAIVYEPVGDILGMAYYPEVGQIAWFESFDRKIPLFIGLIYFCYFPPFILYFMRLHRRGISQRTWWKIWLITVVSTFVFEPIPLHAGLWQYYGAQPFVVFKFPLYWAFLNATFVFGTAMGVTFIVNYFNGGKNWMVVPALPMLLYVFHGAPTLPVATALSMSDSLWVTSLGGIGTIALCVMISWLGSQLFCCDARRDESHSASI